MIYFPFYGFNFSVLNVNLIFSRSKKTYLIINKVSLDFLLINYCDFIPTVSAKKQAATWSFFTSLSSGSFW